MDFELDDVQRDMQAVVRDFLKERSSEEAVRVAMDTPSGYDPDVWKQMAEQLGLQGLIVPEEFGGTGLGYVELGAVLEEMGRMLLCAPYFSTAVLAPTLLRLLEDAKANAAYLPGIASGSIIATVALTEDGGAIGEEAVTLRAEPTADGWRLTGSKNYVLDGHTADLLLVVARSAGGVSVFAVEGTATGLVREALPTMDQTRKQARLTLADTPAILVAAEGAAWPAVDTMLDIAAVMLAAEQTGGAQRALDLAVEYAKVREQFGRPIGSFQAIKHMCANMLVRVESMRSAAYYGMWAASELNEELSTVAHLTKSFCSDAYMFVTKEMIQVHGGIGFTWEHPAHLYLKRAHSSKVLLGDPAFHREQLATAIGL
ncbi:acyl-CoA dehydrogenase family protein [Phytohabitans suffuscus]|uniref:Acyl-CoA dehydrogenase n=1 Tax=Phytohabitans suffuscus TaxID=624315 RepID=A0A6F8YRA1_9ACTN|nr:acyl-CoA dehydrogenase [Phytohabitans suffuscus]